jgi:hypothetical protein
LRRRKSAGNLKKQTKKKKTKKKETVSFFSIIRFENSPFLLRFNDMMIDRTHKKEREIKTQELGGPLLFFKTHRMNRLDTARDDNESLD